MGQLFDANPQVGGSRYNAPIARPLSPLVGGNAFATGNVGRGLSLESYSPILSPTAFRGTLGSSTLSAFRRDSVDVGRASDPYGGLAPWGYFDSSSTVPNVSYLQGDYGGGGAFSTPVLGTDHSGRSNLAAFEPYSPYGTAPMRSGYSTDASGTDWSAATNPQLSSSIFGVARPSLPGPLSQQSNAPGTPDSTYLPDMEGAGAWPGLEQSGPLDTGGPLDLRMNPPANLAAEMPNTPVDIYEQRSAADAILNGDSTGGAFTPYRPIWSGPIRGRTVFASGESINTPNAPTVNRVDAGAGSVYRYASGGGTGR